jgi:S-DNA-T family DNA segregation ATPase FtsK/SpoIIIE
MGIIGKIIFQTATRNIGLGAYIFPVLLLFLGIVILFNYKPPNPYNKLFGICFLFIIFLTFIHLRLLLLDNSYSLAMKGAGGGLLGYYFANSLYLYFGTKGAYLVLISLSLISALFITEVSYFYVFGNLGNKIKIILNNILNIIKNIGTKISKRSRRKEEPDYQEYETDEIPRKIFKIKKTKKKEETIFDKDYQEPKVERYQVPPLSLLSDSYAEDKTGSKTNIEENVKILESTFTNFGINAKVVGVIQGPTVTRYEIHPAPGVKIAKITNLSNDIALSFAVASVRIEAPIPGKNAVGIEVPNRKRINVYLKEILQSSEFQNRKYKLPIALGIDIGGKPIVADLTELPHLLIAGATGSGKSVCINNVILSILYKLSPEEVKFLMIDPKRVELNIYNGIPHLLIPIITDASQAIKVLNWAIYEMEKRFKIFAEAGVRNLEGYNEYVRNINNGTKSLPCIIIVIDELADLMLSSPVKAEESLCRLAQMTRATGIHLIIATQRPSVDIITGSIKVNFPSRIAFAVSTQVDSIFNEALSLS